ncbi:PP2C family protein-serine/threonine phosphatase [Haliangium sp.]
MVLFIVAGACALVGLVAAIRARRQARTSAAELELSLEPLIELANTSLRTRYLEEAFDQAYAAAVSSFAAERVSLVYLAEDRSTCYCLMPNQKPIELPTVFWNTLLHAPWQEGMLWREMLAHVPQAVAMPLQEFTTRLRADVLLAWIDRKRLICVTAVTFGRRLDERGQTLLQLWHTSLVHACANHIIERHVEFQRALIHEIEQARTIMDSLPSRAQNGAAGGLAWSIHERPQEVPGSAFWDVYELSDGCLLIIAGEMIAGGLAAAMLSIAVRSCCDTLYDLAGDELEPYRLLDGLNRFLWRETNPVGMTCIVVRFDPRAGTAEYAVAGPMSMWRVGWQDHHAMVELCPGGGPPVGSGPAADYLLEKREIAPGDAFFLLAQRASRSVWYASDEALPDPRFDGADSYSPESLCRLFAAAVEDDNVLNSTPVIVVRRQHTD